MYKVLNEEECVQFKEWARNNYVPELIDIVPGIKEVHNPVVVYEELLILKELIENNVNMYKLNMEKYI